MNKDINYTLTALVPLLRMNGEKVVSVEAVEDWYEIDGREYMKEVAEITYENGYRQYADIGCDANLTAVYDVIRVIQQVKPKSEKIERIVRDVYPKPEPTKGKWIVKANGGNTGERTSHTCICPKCGATYYCYDKGQYQIETSNFCPNCGEKMNPDAPDTNVEDWTSVSEGLPDLSVEVLTYTESADLIEIQTREVNVEGEYHWENQHGDCQDEQAVTKWRPLPKRPRPHAK